MYFSPKQQALGQAKASQHNSSRQGPITSEMHHLVILQLMGIPQPCTPLFLGQMNIGYKAVQLICMATLFDDVERGADNGMRNNLTHIDDLVRHPVSVYDEAVHKRQSMRKCCRIHRGTAGIFCTILASAADTLPKSRQDAADSCSSWYYQGRHLGDKRVHVIEEQLGGSGAY